MRRLPRSTRTDTPFPYTTRFQGNPHAGGIERRQQEALLGPRQRQMRERQQRGTGQRQQAQADGGAAAEDGRGDRHRRQQQQREGGAEDSGDEQQRRQLNEIGRASWRERGGMYG